MKLIRFVFPLAVALPCCGRAIIEESGDSGSPEASGGSGGGGGSSASGGGPGTPVRAIDSGTSLGAPNDRGIPDATEPDVLGIVAEQSCAPGGPGMTNCGPGGSGTESCCTSLEVPGGAYYRLRWRSRVRKAAQGQVASLPPG